MDGNHPTDFGVGAQSDWLISLEPTKQMLIGYKVEYLAEKGIDCFLDLRIITLNAIDNLDRELNRQIEEIEINFKIVGRVLK